MTIAACRASADASGTVKEAPPGEPPPEPPPESSPPEPHAARSNAAAVTVAVAVANLSLWRLLKPFDIFTSSRWWDISRLPTLRRIEDGGPDEGHGSC